MNPMIPAMTRITPRTIATILVSIDASPVTNRDGKGLCARGGRGSRKRRDPGLRPPEDQCVDVVRAFIGVDRLEIHHVADHMELVGNAVTAMHVAGGTRDVERFAG